MAKGINKYRVFDVDRGSFTIDATTARDALENLGYYNIEKTEMGNIHIIGLSGDKRNYVFTATYCNKEGDKRTNEDINNYLRLAIMEEVNKRMGKNFECVNDLIDYAKNLEQENKQLEIDNYNHNANLQLMSDMLDEAKKIIKDLLGSESHCCTEDDFFEIRKKAEIFIRDYVDK